MNRLRTSWHRFLNRKADTTKLLLGMVFLVLVFLPLIRMFANIDGASLSRVLGNSGFAAAVCRSLVASVLSTVIAVGLAWLMAWLVQRSAIRYKGIFSAIFVLPMLIPSLSHGMGLVILFGNNGIVTNLLGWSPPIYGLLGIVLGSVLYAFPVAYLMLVDVMKYEDGAAYEAARVLGVPTWRQFVDISLPYLRKPLISVVFATFTLVVTDYGVPLMVGGKFTTLPVMMYQDVIGQLDFGKGAVYGTVLLLPAVAAFLLDMLGRDKGGAAQVHVPIVPRSGRRDGVAYAAVSLMAVVLVLPIVAFIVLGFSKEFPNDLTLTFEHVIRAVNLRADRYLGTSLLIALTASVVGVVVAGTTAYLAARMKSAASRFLHLSVIVSATVPGVVLGLSYVLFFKGSPLYGTLAILVMVNVAHFISSPYLMMYNSLSKINGNLEGVAHTLGISRFRLIRDVLVPMCAKTILEMFAYFFVNCMMTISAVSFLSTAVYKPLSLMINQFEAQMQLECAAVVSLVILAVNVLLKGGLSLVKRRLSKRGGEV